MHCMSAQPTVLTSLPATSSTSDGITWQPSGQRWAGDWHPADQATWRLPGWLDSGKSPDCWDNWTVQCRVVFLNWRLRIRASYGEQRMRCALQADLNLGFGFLYWGYFTGSWTEGWGWACGSIPAVSPEGQPAKQGKVITEQALTWLVLGHVWAATHRGTRSFLPWDCSPLRGTVCCLVYIGASTTPNIASFWITRAETLAIIIFWDKLFRGNFNKTQMEIQFTKSTSLFHFLIFYLIGTLTRAWE